MNTKEIFDKYANAIDEALGNPATMPISTALLALHLAVQEAHTDGMEWCATDTDVAAIIASQDASLIALQDALVSRQVEIDRLRAQRHEQPDRRHYEHLQAQITRLNEWLAEHEPGLYISPGDTADATLAAIGNRDQRIAELNADLEKLQTDVDAEIAELDAFARLPLPDYSQASHVNGAEPPANPTTQPDWNRNHPAWDGMSDEERIVLYQLTKGDLRFRNISKAQRIDLVRRVLRHLTAAVDPLIQFHFDRMRPHWMPTSGAVVALVESRKWKDLLTMALEPATA